jgi:hypothetical protein
MKSNGKVLKSGLLAVVAGLSIGIAGCGGGGGGDSPAPTATTTAEGLYTGTMSSGRTFDGLVLDDGTYYFLYSAIGNPGLISGVVQGNDGTSNGTTFSSNNQGTDFNLEGGGVVSASVFARYIADQSISGDVSVASHSGVEGGGGSATFSGTYNPLYLATPSLAVLAGTFTGQVATSAGIENAAVSVMSNGALSGIGASGCSFTGTAAPRAHGNVFDISITFGGAPCLFSYQVFLGIAFLDTGANRLYAAAPNVARTNGVLFVGTKP